VVLALAQEADRDRAQARPGAALAQVHPEVAQDRALAAVLDLGAALAQVQVPIATAATPRAVQAQEAAPDRAPAPVRQAVVLVQALAAALLAARVAQPQVRQDRICR
jgi:hypothetical protein